MGICLNAFPLPGSNLLDSSNCTDLSRPLEVGSSHLEHMLPGLPPGWSPSRRLPRLTVRCLDSKGPCALRCTSQPPCEVGTVPLASKEEPDSETLRSMPKVTQLVNGRGKSGPGLSPLSATADEPACAEVATALQTGWEGRPEVREELLPNEEIPFSFSLKKENARVLSARCEGWMPSLFWFCEVLCEGKSHEHTSPPSES